MKRLTRYVFTQLFLGMILVTLALTAVVWLTQSLRFVEMIVNRGLSAGTFLYLTMLLLPNFIALILPVAMFAVVLFIYNRMIMDRELVVMRAAGLGPFSLSKPAIILAFCVMCTGYLLNLYLVPESYRMFRALQWDIRYNFSHILLQEGTFNTVSNGVTVYVRERTADGQLLGILAHDTRKPERPMTLMAERGAMVKTDDGARVLMTKGNRQEVNKKTNQMSVLYFDRYVFDLNPSGGKTTNIRHREARERSLDDLFNIHLDKNISDHGKYIMEAHKRLAHPLLAVSLALIALSVLLTGPFTRRTQSRRVVFAIVVAVVLQGSLLGIENLAAKNLKLVPLVYALCILPGILSLLFMARTPRLRAPTRPQGA